MIKKIRLKSNSKPPNKGKPNDQIKFQTFKELNYLPQTLLQNFKKAQFQVFPSRTLPSYQS